MNDFIGIPFLDGNETFDGANCYGLCKLFYKEYLGIELPTISVQSNHSRAIFSSYLKTISECWDEIDYPEPYCIVAMSYDLNHPRLIQHFGVCLDDGKILHTLKKINSHIASIDTLKPYIKKYYKFKN